jgi:hypothetical protein
VNGWRVAIAYGVWMILTSAAIAEPPTTSLFPQPKPGTAVTETEQVTPLSNLAVAKSMFPKHRPSNIAALEENADRTEPPPAKLETRGGGLCGNKRLKGDVLSAIRPGISGCGIEEPVRVSMVAGLTLSTKATMDCQTANALEDWVSESVIPTVGRYGGGAEGLQVAAHYVCRTRNNQPGARISEHGKGHAIDIAAIILANGKTINVLRDWGKGKGGTILKKIRQAACGTFGTVLGPGSDRFHRDHFHLDTARYRSGSYCQ